MAEPASRWPLRVRRSHQLPLNEPEHRNAIHGLVRWATWTAAEREPHRAVMEHVLHPQPGYPFSLRISIEYALTDCGLRVRTTARNLGTDPRPYGSGAHPYLTLGTATIDNLILRVPARTVLRSDERGLPIGTEAVEHTEYNFQTPRRIGSTRLDQAFTDLERDEEGRSPFVREDGNAARAIWFPLAPANPQAPAVLVRSPAHMPAENRSKRLTTPSRWESDKQAKARFVRLVPKADSCTAAYPVIRSPRRRARAASAAHRGPSSWRS